MLKKVTATTTTTHELSVIGLADPCHLLMRGSVDDSNPFPTTYHECCSSSSPGTLLAEHVDYVCNSVSLKWQHNLPPTICITLNPFG
jgi:hypothetical protein